MDQLQVINLRMARLMRTGLGCLVTAIGVVGAVGCRESSAASSEAPSAPSSAAVLPTASNILLAAPNPGLESGNLESLGQEVVRLLARGDHKGLQQLAVSEPEYVKTLFPAFVRAGEPLLASMGSAWAWENLEHNSRKDLRRLFTQFGGKPIGYVSMTHGEASLRGSLQLFSNPKISVRLNGEVLQFGLGLVVASANHFKVLRY